jgi:RNA polymerase sigma-70 factor, ECF subfamily
VTSENELISRAQAGDKDAFCVLTRCYQRRIHSLALYYCRNSYDAEDLSQEVWMKAYRNISGFRGEAGFYTWLRQITVNTFLNYKRAAASQPVNATSAASDQEVEVAEFAALNADAEAEMYNKLMVEKLTQALTELTAQQRLIFLLKHREGMTYEEVAKSIGCSTGTVKKALFRAVTKLREHMGAGTPVTPCAPNRIA